MKTKLYKITNISEQQIEMTAITDSGETVTDYLEIGEVVYGILEKAACRLSHWQAIGMLEIVPCNKSDIDSNNRWLKEGF